MPMGRLPDIVIVGASLAGWMAAAALAKAFGDHASNIRLLDTPQYQSPEAFGSTTPAIRLFHDKLAISEDEVLRKTGGTFKLATRFTRWMGSEGSFLHPYGQYGTSIGTVGFHHCWFRLRQQGEAAALVDYSLAGVAASLGRFARPLSDQDSVFSSFSYGFHFDPKSYADYLRSYAIDRGVIVECSNTFDVALRGSDGFIDALRFDDGRQLVGDIYLDCTESDAVLAEQALHTGYEDWSRWLPCDRLLYCRSAADANPFPITQISAGKAGWRWRIPLRDHTSDGMVFCSNFIDAETAREEL
jgi:tryptophan halogenase